MNVFLGITDNFITHAVETVYSIRNNSSEHIDVYLFIDIPDISDIQTFLNNIGFPDVRFICFDNREFDMDFKYDISGLSWPRVVFARLHMFSKFPKDIDRVLFIDADAFIMRPGIEQFYNQNIHDFYAAACVDLPVMLFDKKELFNMEVDEYFNMGCLTVNLEKIRNDGIINKIIQLFETESDLVKKAHYADQSIANYVFHGNILWSDQKFNTQSIMLGIPSYDHYLEHHGYHPRGVISLLNECVVFHNTGKAKPWDLDSFKTWQSYQYPYRKQHGIWYNMLVKDLKTKFPKVNVLYQS